MANVHDIHGIHVLEITSVDGTSTSDLPQEDFIGMHKWLHIKDDQTGKHYMINVTLNNPTNKNIICKTVTDENLLKEIKTATLNVIDQLI